MRDLRKCKEWDEPGESRAVGDRGDPVRAFEAPNYNGGFALGWQQPAWGARLSHLQASPAVHLLHKRSGIRLISCGGISSPALKTLSFDDGWRVFEKFSVKEFLYIFKYLK